jgi:hypothetical protein
MSSSTTAGEPFMPDMGAFPVLRLDQISRIDSALLQRSTEDALALINELEREASTPPKLVYYLKRQINSVKAELALRVADERIKGLMSGRDNVVDTTQASAVDGQMTADTEAFAPRPDPIMATTAVERELPGLSFIPLPSQRPKVPEQSSSQYSTARSSEKATVDVSMSNLTTRPRKPAQTQKLPRDEPAEELSVHAESSAAAGPSKRSLEAVFQNFGTQFVVAATERRRRYFPKKQPVKDVTLIKESERLERCCFFGCYFMLCISPADYRRNAALKRLADRKREREVVREVDANNS